MTKNNEKTLKLAIVSSETLVYNAFIGVFGHRWYLVAEKGENIWFNQKGGEK